MIDRNSYLQVLLPLSLCLASLLLLVRAKVFRATSSSKSLRLAYDDQDGRDITARTLVLDRSALRLLHALLSLVQIANQFTFLIIAPSTARSRLIAGAGIIVWAYISLIAFARTVRPSDRVLHLHLFTLFGVSWLLTAPVFWRSIIVRTSRDRIIAITTNFVILTIATVTALTLSSTSVSRTLAAVDGGSSPASASSSSILGSISYAWLNPLLNRGYNSTLTPADIPDLELCAKAVRIKQNFRRTPAHKSFRRRLWQYSRRRVLFQSLWGYFYSFNSFVPPILIKSILEQVETRQPSRSAWSYVALLLISGLLSALSGSEPLWIGRKLTVELQAVIVGEVYDKILRLRSTAGLDEDDNSGRINQLSSGKVMNLMSVDAAKVSEGASYLFWTWAEVPTQIVIATILLLKLLGPAAMTGIAVLILLAPVNIIIARQLTSTQRELMNASDARIQSTSELLQSIRIVKLFVWQTQLSKPVLQHRTRELRMLRLRFIFLSAASCINRATPLLITLVTFYFYTYVQKQTLIPSVTFTALSLFTILRPPLDQITSLVSRFQTFRVSLHRLERFLHQPETAKYALLRHTGQPESDIIGFENAFFQWDLTPQTSQHQGVSERSPLLQLSQQSSFSLEDLNIRFHKDRLNVIVGATGSGKSSLLLALIGEMPLVSGKVYPPSGHRSDSRGVAYCAQQPWLMNSTIRQNIIFYADWDEARYLRTIFACALEPDLKIFPAGDATVVGEKGIALSGGQKQRIALARAVYSRTEYLVLDDCLSAVDTHTAEWVFRRAITGDITCSRTLILATHNTDLCLSSADHVIILESGKVLSQGHPSQLPPSYLISIIPQESSHRGTSKHADSNRTVGKIQERKKTQTATETLLFDEKRFEGSLATRTLTTYLDAMGGTLFWAFAIVALAGTPLASVATNLWIRKWSNSYNEKPDSFLSAQEVISSSAELMDQSKPILSTFVNTAYYIKVYGLISLIYLVLSTFRDGLQFGGSLRASSKLYKRLLQQILRARFVFFDTTPFGQILNRFTSDIELLDQELAREAGQTLDCLTSIGTTIIVVSVFTPYFLVVGCVLSIAYYLIGKYFLRTSRDLKHIEAVSRSPLFQHFGETYDGLATIRAFGCEDRFISESCEKVDTHNKAYYHLWAANRWLAFRVDVMGGIVAFAAAAFVVLSIGNVDPGAAGLNLLYTLTFNENVVFLLRRSANNEQNFTAVERIKEYLDVDQEAADEIPDNEPSPVWPAQGAIEFVNYSTSYRRELGPVLQNINLSILPGERIGVVGRTGAGKSSLALALSRGLEADGGHIYIDGVDISTMGLNTLRRGLVTVPQDPTLLEGTLRSNVDPLGLYSDGQVKDILIRLRLVRSKETDEMRSLSVPPLSSTSVNHSTSVDDREDTHQAIVLNTTFTSIYHRILSTGSNLSQGQRQLVCIARALLTQTEPHLSSGNDQSTSAVRSTTPTRRSRILIFDEATSSIDRASEIQIQSAIRSTDATIITIAHRLRTIADYDRIVVLEKGSIVEVGRVAELIELEEGWFRGLCEGSSEVEVIREIARRKQERQGTR